MTAAPAETPTRLPGIVPAGPIRQRQMAAAVPFGLLQGPSGEGCGCRYQIERMRHRAGGLPETGLFTWLTDNRLSFHNARPRDHRTANREFGVELFGYSERLTSGFLLYNGDDLFRPASRATFP